MLQMTLRQMGAFLSEGAKRVGCDELTYLKCQIDGEEQLQVKREAERQEYLAIRTARLAVEPMLLEIYRANGEVSGGRFDTADVCNRLGLPVTQGNKMWASRKLLDYQRREQCEPATATIQ